MIKAKYHNKNLRISTSINESEFIFKVDTGAQMTVISLNKIVPNIQRSNLDSIKSRLQRKSKALAYSTSGHELEGVICKFENVYLDEVKLEYLYVGIILNESVNTALLGLDFLQGCTFSHSAGGDMFIESVDCSYQEKVIKDTYGNCDEIYTIDEILSMCNIEDSLNILKSLI